MLAPIAPVALRRYPPSPATQHLVRHYWIPRWDLPPGRTLVQEVLEYPAANLVIEAAGTAIHPMSPGRSRRELSGRGRAVGVLLRPATARLLVPDADIRPGVPLPCPHAPGAEVNRAVDGPGDVAAADARAVSVLEAWFAGLSLRLDDAALLVNAAVDAVEHDETLVRVDELVDRLGTGYRELHRAVRHHLGVTPRWIIARHRLQEAAAALQGPEPPALADLAARLGYADQPHFSRDFARFVGVSPARYRDRRGRPPLA